VLEALELEAFAAMNRLTIEIVAPTALVVA
jgi:hypothetical protein